MTEYYTMMKTVFTHEDIAAIQLLEEQCRQYEQIQLRVGIEHLASGSGDHAILCYHYKHLVGVLTWYSVDNRKATINGMVHADYRRQGLFHRMLELAKTEMERLGIDTFNYRVVSGSQSGLGFIQHLDGKCSKSEYSLILTSFEAAELRQSALSLHLMESADLAFAVKCSSLAFGDTEDWTREYFAQTDKPNRATYVATLDNSPLGLIRVLRSDLIFAVIHDFCVLPTYQRQGYGRAILSETVKLLLAEGYTQIHLNVVTDNEQALQLYHEVGFEITSEFSDYVG
ncbi:MAG: GNAT family N-acetyltransferase [Gorillibacterium sp.]|nr:GNAT family N-acetyltransferase [Gorillibacterium sp.]